MPYSRCRMTLCWLKFQKKSAFKALVMGGYGVAAGLLAEPDVVISRE